jgi:hypothetical protein
MLSFVLRGSFRKLSTSESTGWTIIFGDEKLQNNSKLARTLRNLFAPMKSFFEIQNLMYFLRKRWRKLSENFSGN